MLDNIPYDWSIFPASKAEKGQKGQNQWTRNQSRISKLHPSHEFYIMEDLLGSLKVTIGN